MRLAEWLAEQKMGYGQFARLAGLRSRQVVYQYATGYRRPGVDAMIRIEAATGIPREELRPDLFRTPATERPAAPVEARS